MEAIHIIKQKVVDEVADLDKQLQDAMAQKNALEAVGG